MGRLDPKYVPETEALKTHPRALQAERKAAVIDHRTFTDAYNKHSKGMLYLARKLYRIDPDRLAAETWTRLWSIRDRIDTIKPVLLRVIMSGLVKTYWRDAVVEQKRLENYARMPKSEWADFELPKIDLEKLLPVDRKIYRRLLKYAQRRENLKDTGIPRRALMDFRNRMRQRFLDKIG